MGFIGGLISAAVKTVATPIAIVADIATLGKKDITKTHISSIGDDVEDALMNSDSFL
jgi:hypothetical protein